MTVAVINISPHTFFIGFIYDEELNIRIVQKIRHIKGEK